jgi:predicted ABC-class ATPase
MGVPEGVTLIVGGGFHGKSCLVQAIAAAVFPHVPGDGRELCATLASSAVIRAEDGRPRLVDHGA